ncbi:SDR family oxidoreductase [bacterium]|nr:MAG: SDR family oxidoreductase [bacterium]
MLLLSAFSYHIVSIELFGAFFPLVTVNHTLFGVKTILITGASSGIGKATAVAFAQRGWNVVATMRDPRAGAELAAMGNVLVARLDVKDPATIAEAIEAGIARFGAIDMLLNNAGMNYFGAFEELTPAQVREIFDVNVVGVMDVTRAVLPHFRERGAGTVVNLTSASGLMAFPLQSLYVSTKHAVEGFSESLAYELATLNIGVKLIEPGLVKTNMTAKFETDVSATASISDYQQFTTHTIGLFEGMMAGDIPEASVVAGRIFEAATDGTNRLRYLVTDDVAPLVEMRESMPDEAFVSHMRSMFLPQQIGG